MDSEELTDLLSEVELEALPLSDGEILLLELAETLGCCIDIIIPFLTTIKCPSAVRKLPVALNSSVSKNKSALKAVITLISALLTFIPHAGEGEGDDDTEIEELGDILYDELGDQLFEAEVEEELKSQPLLLPPFTPLSL